MIVNQKIKNLDSFSKELNYLIFQCMRKNPKNRPDAPECLKMCEDEIEKHQKEMKKNQVLTFKKNLDLNRNSAHSFSKKLKEVNLIYDKRNFFKKDKLTFFNNIILENLIPSLKDKDKLKKDFIPQVKEKSFKQFTVENSFEFAKVNNCHDLKINQLPKKIHNKENMNNQENIEVHFHRQFNPNRNGNTQAMIVKNQDLKTYQKFKDEKEWKKNLFLKQNQENLKLEVYSKKNEENKIKKIDSKLRIEFKENNYLRKNDNQKILFSQEIKKKRILSSTGTKALIKMQQREKEKKKRIESGQLKKQKINCLDPISINDLNYNEFTPQKKYFIFNQKASLNTNEFAKKQSNEFRQTGLSFFFNSYFDKKLDSYNLLEENVSHLGFNKRPSSAFRINNNNGVNYQRPVSAVSGLI